jgi:sarcosine oxidase delta subunit
VHAYGCRRWFNVARDTASYVIEASYKPGDPPPEAP